MPLRCMVDSMVFDAIVAEPGLLALVDRLTTGRRLELLAELDTMVEIAATPDADYRRRLQRVRVLVVPPPEDELVFGPLRASVGVSDEDARIAIAAAQRDVPLVTEDRHLRAAAALHLPQLTLWRWEADLRPRIVAL